MLNYVDKLIDDEERHIHMDFNISFAELEASLDDYLFNKYIKSLYYLDQTIGLGKKAWNSKFWF